MRYIGILFFFVSFYACSAVALQQSVVLERSSFPSPLSARTRSFLYGIASGTFSDMIRHVVMFGIAYRMRDHYPFFAFLSIPDEIVGRKESSEHLFSSQRETSLDVAILAAVYGYISGICTQMLLHVYGKDVWTAFDKDVDPDIFSKGTRYGRNFISVSSAAGVFLSCLAEASPFMSYLGYSELTNALSTTTPEGFLQACENVLARFWLSPQQFSYGD